jgi:hypothetical protein
VDEIDGRSGELINRLIELLDNDALGDGVWYDVGSSVQHVVGDRVLSSSPDTGRGRIPRTPGYELVRRERWFAQIRERLLELEASGIFEPFRKSPHSGLSARRPIRHMPT